MSEFEQPEQPESDDNKLRSELYDVGVSNNVINKIISLKNNAQQKLYAKEIEAARKINVSSAGEIPAKFAGQNISGRAAIRRIMFVALINGVLRPDTPFRRLWYQFVKASLQGLSSEFSMSTAFYGGMSSLVKETGLDYKDFGITNMGEKDESTGKRQLMRGAYEITNEMEHKFPNVMLGIEDASYYGVFKNMAKLLGLHRYSAGGQSNLSSTEVITDELKEKVDMRSDYPLHIRSVTDYDPAGFNISNAYLDHFSRYLGDMITSKRFAPLMKHYTLQELVQNMYIVKLNMISQNVWDKEVPDLEKYVEAYKERTGIDFSDSFDWHKKAQKILLKNDSTYQKGVRKGLGKAPKIKGKSSDLKWNNTPQKLKDDIQDFLNNEIPQELIEWWKNTVKGGAEGARPPDLSENPVDLFNFIAENEFIYPYGVELASVPETPLEPEYYDGEPIYDYENPEFIKGSHESSGVGQARMRLLTFDEIVEEFGMDAALKYYFTAKEPYTSTISENFISSDTSEGMSEITNINYENRDILYEIDGIIENWFAGYLKEERNDLEEKINEWLKKTKRKYLDPDSEEYDEDLANEEKKKIWKKLREAVLRDNDYIYYSFPEDFKHTEYGYEEDFRLIIPNDIFESLKPIVYWAECIKLNLVNMKDTLYDFDHNDLTQNWDDVIPDVMGCKIDEEGNSYFSKDDNGNNDDYKDDYLALQKKYEELEKDYVKERTECRSLYDVIHKKNNELEECKKELEEKEEKIVEKIIEVPVEKVVEKIVQVPIKKEKKEFEKLQERYEGIINLFTIKNTEYNKISDEIYKNNALISEYKKQIKELQA